MSSAIAEDFDTFELQSPEAPKAVTPQGESRLKRRISKEIQHFARLMRQGSLLSGLDKFLVEMVEPLALYQPSDLDCQPEEECHAEWQSALDFSAPADACGMTDEEAMAWSDNALVHLHEGVLSYSLLLLRSRGNAREKVEVLDWIFSEDSIVHKKQGADGRTREVLLAKHQMPFSFQACCRIAGLDFEAVRSGLEWVLKQRLDAASA